MALQINYTASTGSNHPESYWKIEKINYDFSQNKIYLFLDGYHNQAARQQLKNPLVKNKGIELTNGAITEASDIRAVLYLQLLDTPFFDGATNV